MHRVLSLLLGCLIWWTAAGTAAQGINDIPSPDQLRETTETPLRIDWPSDGESVKVPFTVTGVATPGARLELWLDGELQRKFIADANGRFNTAVAKAPQDGVIEIRQVDRGPDPTQMVQVSVLFGGAAAAVAPVAPVATSGDPDSPDASNPTPPAPDEIDPFAPPEATSSGLPRVSELGGTPGTSAPVPPPPSAAAAAFSADEAATPAAGNADIAAQELEAATPLRRRRTPPRTTRYFAEAGVGLGAGLVIGFGGVMAGGAIGLATGDPFAALGFGLVGGMLGAVVGIPLGVVLTGNALDGNGKWWAAVLGEISGILLASVLTAGYASVSFDGIVPVMLFATLPTFGAAAGYELTSDKSAQDAEAGLTTLQPSIQRTADGDVTFGLQLRF